jgi:hypothetical protein
MSQSTQWEYKSVATWGWKAMGEARQEIQKSVNELGRDGWEMVNFAFQTNTNAAGEPRSYDAMCFMKRPL